MVSVGGEVRCFGKAPRNAKSWIIGLQDPNLANEQGMGLVMTLSLPAGSNINQRGLSAVRYD